MEFGTQLGLGPGHIVLDGDTALPPQRGTAPTQFSAHLLRPNGCMDQDATWYGARPQPRRLCVRWGPRSTSPKKAAEPPPQFSAHFYCGQTAACIKMPFGMQVGLSPGDFVLDGDPAPPKFSAHVYYSYCDFVRTLHNAQSLLFVWFKFKF